MLSKHQAVTFTRIVRLVLVPVSGMSTTVFSLAIIKSCYALNLMKLENIFSRVTFHVRAALCELPFEFLDWSECLVFTGLARPASAA